MRFASFRRPQDAGQPGVARVSADGPETRPFRGQCRDLGKSFDTFCPMGPWVVTADELDGRDTRIRCWVNDELRQDGCSADMIFDIPTLVETVSRGITLLPGDVIATGTPAGVGMGLQPPRWLRRGDRVRISIDGLGTIDNRFV